MLDYIRNSHKKFVTFLKNWKNLILLVFSYHLLFNFSIWQTIILHSIQLITFIDQNRAKNWQYLFRRTDGKVETTITSMKYQPIGKLQCKLHIFFLFHILLLKKENSDNFYRNVNGRGKSKRFKEKEIAHFEF